MTDNIQKLRLASDEREWADIHDMASEAIHAEMPREPSTDVILAALGDAGLKRVRAAEAERAASGHHTIVYMHVADEWELTAAYVLDAIFGEGKVRVVDPAERAMKGGNLNSGILAIAQRTHVALVDPTDDEVDAVTVALADVALDLRRLRSEHVESVVRKRFDEPRFAWPRDLSARKFEPLWFDYAVARARCCADVVKLLRAQIAESKRVKLRDDADAAKEAARKAASGKSPVVIRPLRPSSPKLESLEGYGAAGAWGVEFLRDMIDYAQKKIAWADVDAGALLVGPPGTGKTLFATALAASAGLPLLATSYATWQASGEAHLGTLIKAMRATFEAAAAHAPCIVFIDELDAIPSRNSISSAKSDAGGTRSSLRCSNVWMGRCDARASPCSRHATTMAISIPPFCGPDGSIGDSRLHCPTRPRWHRSSRIMRQTWTLERSRLSPRHWRGWRQALTSLVMLAKPGGVHDATIGCWRERTFSQSHCRPRPVRQPSSGGRRFTRPGTPWPTSLPGRFRGPCRPSRRTVRAVSSRCRRSSKTSNV